MFRDIFTLGVFATILTYSLLGDVRADEPPSDNPNKILAVSVDVSPKDGPANEKRSVTIRLRNVSKSTVQLFNPELERHLPKTMSIIVHTPDGNLYGDLASNSGGSRRPATNDSDWTILKVGESKVVEIPLDLERFPDVLRPKNSKLPTGDYSVQIDVLRIMQTPMPWYGNKRLAINDDTPFSRKSLIFKMRTRMEIEYPKDWDKAWVSSPQVKFSVTDK